MKSKLFSITVIAIILCLVVFYIAFLHNTVKRVSTTSPSHVNHNQTNTKLVIRIAKTNDLPGSDVLDFSIMKDPFRSQIENTILYTPKQPLRSSLNMVNHTYGHVIEYPMIIKLPQRPFADNHIPYKMVGCVSFENDLLGVIKTEKEEILVRPGDILGNYVVKSIMADQIILREDHGETLILSYNGGYYRIPHALYITTHEIKEYFL